MFLLAIAKFALSVTICEKFAIEMCTTLTLPLEWINIKYKYANGKALCEFLFVGNSSVCPLCHHLRYISNRIVHDLDLDLYNIYIYIYANEKALWFSITRFESLTFKMKVKDVDDLDEKLARGRSL